MSRVPCIPFPHHEMSLTAEISPRTCLTNQAAGLMVACKKCKTGRQVKKDHPEIVITLKRPTSWGNPQAKSLFRDTQK